MTDELKPVRCGCGGEAQVMHPSYTHCIVVMCGKCGIKTPYMNTEAEAVTAWNRAMGARTKGEWVDGLPYVNSHWWVCSICHVSAPENHTGYNFCPNCGADLRGER